MKKTNLMRVAVVMLALTMITSSFVGGTFAKYVRSETVEDIARVAKFGVNITFDSENSGSFAATYKKADDGIVVNADPKFPSGSSSIYAKKNNVVAPGTSGYMIFNITGTPEVATKLTISTEGSKDIYLGPDTYKIKWSKDAAEEEGVTIKDGYSYHPIKWTLYKKAADADDSTYAAVEGVADVTLADLETALKTLEKSYEPNEELNYSYKLEWKWEFEPADDADESEYDNVTWIPEGAVPYEGAKKQNYLDTILGCLMSEKSEGYVSVNPDSFSTDTRLSMVIQIEQVGGNYAEAVEATEEPETPEETPEE